jgi:Ca2+-binding EF-hand superfamily protein
LQARILFNTIDSDRSGFVTEEELENFLAGFGVTSIVTAARALMSNEDENSDGKVSFTEFEKHMTPFYLYAFEVKIFAND